MTTRIQAGPGRGAVHPMGGADHRYPPSAGHFLSTYDPVADGTHGLLDMAQAVDYVGDAGQARDLLRMLDEALRADVPALRRLVGQGDLNGAQRLLHPLKSFVPIFCSHDLAGKVAQVEALSKAGDLAALRTAWETLEPALRALQTQIAGQLS